MTAFLSKATWRYVKIGHLSMVKRAEIPMQMMSTKRVPIPNQASLIPHVLLTNGPSFGEFGLVFGPTISPFLLTKMPPHVQQSSVLPSRRIYV